jgi:hypothetical protein
MRVALVAALLLLVGCSTRDGAPADGGADADASDADAGSSADVQCAAWASTWCSTLGRCLPGSLRTSFGSQDTCAHRMAIDCARRIFSASTGIGADDGGACLAALEPSDCGAFIRAFVEGAEPDACAHGAVATGDACGDGLQCQTGMCTYDATGCGVCAAAASGTRLCKMQTDCAPWEYCDQICLALGEAGATCTGTSQCHADLACVSGKCGPRVGLGGSCAKDDADPCANGPEPLVCDTTTSKCVLQQFGKNGDACGPLVWCDYPMICYGVGSTFTCGDLPDDGAACSSDVCRSPARCWKGTCQIIDPAACGAIPP